MKPRWPVILVLGSLLGLCAIPISAAEESWPTRWQINGNGEKGKLEFTIDDRGALVGSMLDVSVEGFVTGRRLVIRRQAGGRSEVWEGWLSQEKAGEARILAGSISIDDGGQTRIYPWFGTLESVETDAPSTATRDGSDPVPSETGATVLVPESTDTAADSGGPLSGVWISSTGERVTVGQDGNRLTVVSSDGASHSGRMTGAASLVVGLRKGCCSGTLESPDVIQWSDGARWERED